MGKKTARKLSVKKETMRRLGALTEDQLRAVAGGTKLVVALDPKYVLQDPILTDGDTFICAGIVGGGGRTAIISCVNRCETTPDLP